MSTYFTENNNFISSASRYVPDHEKQEEIDRLRAFLKIYKERLAHSQSLNSQNKKTYEERKRLAIQNFRKEFQQRTPNPPTVYSENFMGFDIQVTEVDEEGKELENLPRNVIEFTD